jgi:predicted Zn-dependent protease
MGPQRIRASRFGSSVSAGIAILAACCVSCASPPPTTKPAARTVVLETAEVDARVGAQASLEVAAQIGIVKDEKLQAFVEALGQKLVRFAPRQPFSYRFQVVDQWSPNAFALPGGHIFVSRGLLVLTNSEAELACVMAHEITHAAARHAAGRQTFSEQLNPFSLGIPRMASIAAYARDQERAADTGGQRICAAAGYDPRALGVFLQSLDKIERLNMGVSRIPTFLDTHPSSPERVASASISAAALGAPSDRDPRGSREKYLQNLAGLILGTDPAEGVIDGSRFLHPDLDISLGFPAGWAISNTPAAVVAISPKGDARFSLEDAGPGADPEAAATIYLAQRLTEVRAQIDSAEAQATRCCKTYVVRGRLATPQGEIAGQITWVALGGRVYRLTAASRPSAAAKYAERAARMVRSLRPLTPEERASIMVDRLRLARAVQGESIAEFSTRTKNVYDVHRTAIANDLEVGARLDAGQLLKIGLRGPYSGAPERAGEALDGAAAGGL